MCALSCDRPPVTTQVGNEATRVAARNPRPNAVCGWPRSHLRSSTLVMQRLAGRSQDISLACGAAGYTTQCTRPGNDGGGGGAFSAQSACVLQRSHSTGRDAGQAWHTRERGGGSWQSAPTRAQRKLQGGGGGTRTDRGEVPQRPPGTMPSTPTAQHDDPILPTTPDTRVLYRCRSVLAGYHPS